MFESPRLKAALNRLLQVIATVYQGIAILAFLFALFLAGRWLDTPFLGAYFEQTMIKNEAGPRLPSSAWTLYGQIEFGDQLTAVNGVAVRTYEDIENALRGATPGVIPTDVGFSAGETIPITVLRASGEEQTFEVTLGIFPMADRVGYIVIPVVVSGVFLLIGLWIFYQRRRESAGRLFPLCLLACRRDRRPVRPVYHP